MKKYLPIRIDDDILCGDSSNINEAKGYMNIEFIEFKKKEVVYERDNDISKKMGIGKRI
ncbi:MAG: hypothetical protein ACLT5Z_03730 [Eisenbergiella sp.]|nr:hypothetical protein [Bacillota bacterium]